MEARASTSRVVVRAVRRPSATSVLVAALIAAFLVLGVVTVSRFRIWADIDERPHYDYIQKVVEEHRLPRPTDLVSPEVQAITDRTWPRPSTTDRAAIGLPGRSYEAIQPPLYYVAAAPAFMAVGDHRDKVFAVRAFDLALALLAVWLSWLLVRRLADGRAARFALASVLLVVLWPGVVVRAVTIGNTPLELVLAAAFMLLVWRADAERRDDLLLAAAVLLGLGLLTKLTLVCLAPLFLVVLARRVIRRRTGRGAPGALALAAVPLLILAPWLVANLARYGSPTVDIAGAQGVVGPIRSAGILDRVTDLPRLDARLVDGVLPQEWIVQLSVWWVRAVVDVLALILLAAMVVLVVARRREWRSWFFALPFVSGMAIMDVVYVMTGNDAIYLRYLYPTLLPLAAGVGLAAANLATSRVRVAALAGLALLLAVLWVDLAGMFYFNDIGRRLGIV